MKPKYPNNPNWSRLAGISLAAAALGVQPLMADTFWDGSDSSNWNTAANWSNNAVPTGENCFVNVSTPNIATVTANFAATPVDIYVNGTGQVNHISGTGGTGNWNWMFIGVGSGNTGTYNLCDTTGAGGTYTGYAQGSGNLNVGGANNGRLWVGGVGWMTGGTGTFNMNTTGTLNTNDLSIGCNGGVGVMNVDSGTINTVGWNFIAKREGTDGANGTLRMSGGTLSNTGRTYIGNPGGTGTMILNGGTYKNVNNEYFIVGGTHNSEDWFGTTGGTGYFTISNSASWLQSNGEFWVGNRGGTGTVTFSAGLITSNNWVAIGRTGGTGTVTMTGGTWTKTGGGNFIVGSSGPGTMNMSGGLVDVQGGITWVAEQNSSIATLSISGTAEWRTTQFVVAVNAGTTGTLNLDGGTVRTGQITGGGGADTVTFNGTQVVATGVQPAFITAFNTATIGSGGLKLDTGSYAVGADQSLGGTGGVTKTGTGTLTLTGASTYSGSNSVNNGKLVVPTRATATSGDYTVANGATLGITQVASTQSLTVPNATFGTSATTTLAIDLGSIGGNPTAAPLNVTGALTLNGNVTINVTDAMPATGTIPLVSYVGPKAGGGIFVLGSLPLGVAATMTDDGTGSVYLTVTSVSLPRWKGTVDGLTSNGNWDIATTSNWTDMVTMLPTTFNDGAPVTFPDNNNPIFTPNILLNTTVLPSSVTFNNSIDLYTLSGSGKISGTASLLKQGTASLTISTTNDYTGASTFNAGTTTIYSLANGGAPSSIGASSAAASNLVLNGGTLEYVGSNVSIDRGFSITANGSVLNLASDVTMSGEVATAIGTLTKSGAGNLTLTNPGANTFGSGGQGLKVDGGTLTLQGGGTQTNAVGGELWLGSVPNVAANLVLNGTTLTTTSWLAMGRGNGNTGTLTTLTATNSTLTTYSFSTGFDNGLPNDSDQIVSLTNTNWTNNGYTLLGESGNATTTMTLAGTSSFTANGRFLTALGSGSVFDLTIQDTAVLTKTAVDWLSIGNSNNGVATATVKDSGSFIALGGDFNIGDVGTAHGTLTIQDSATVSTQGIAFIGKNNGTSGTMNVTGGSFTCNNWFSIGRYTGGVGVVYVSGGVVNHPNTGTALWVGEDGTGTLTISGTGAVNASGYTIGVGQNATATGTLNLNGGTLTAKQLSGGAGTATLNFDGGKLVAGAGANAAFITGFDTASVKAGGVIVDTNSQNVAVNQALLDGTGGGGLTKIGSGTLFLNGVNTYTGMTNVNVGTLGGTGTVAGPVTVVTTATIAPGASVGTFTVGDTTLDGTYACEVDGTTCDKLVAGNLVITGTSTLAITEVNPATAAVLIIATYTGTTPTPFGTVTGLPTGYTVVYDYNDGMTSTNIALVKTATAYDTWIDSFFPGETNPAIIGKDADPDGDGQSNIVEFALDGNPASAVSTGKMVAKISTVGGDPTLVLVLPVRAGATFSGATEQVSAETDGIIYHIQGSDDLATWGLVVSEVTNALDKAAAEAGMPGLSGAGWTYRTFRSPGSVTGDPADFLRATIEHP